MTVRHQQTLALPFVAVVTLLMTSSACIARAELGRALVALGLGPTAFAAAGMTSGELDSMLSAIDGSAELATLAAARTQVSSAEDQLRLARRTNDPVTAPGAAGIAEATQAALASKEALRAAADALVEHGLSACEPVHRDRIRNWRRARADLSPEFRVIDWDPIDRKQLAAALLEERVVVERGTAMSVGSSVVLQLACARPEVIEAISGLATRLSAFETTIAQASR